MISRTLEVVLIEDNSADVFLISKALQEAGMKFNLRTLTDGEAALDFVEKLDQSAVPDIFVMDWNLPRIHGKDVLRAIGNAAFLSHTPRVVLTSSESPVDRKEVEQLGGLFVSKPRTLDEFMAIGRKIKNIVEPQ